ncbi:MAG: dTDP-4-dehydrorhamnose 3,5-epimerase [Corticimicrobacter sp.]|uniref:dTDP-4-dehydrorhamnose 3,5-epimerase n=1 Tax=Corticimicrobacter sp. TaxID=2678536 RepID=UPI0032DA0FAC
MKLISTNLPGLVIVEPRIYGDSRGWFAESFNADRFEAALVELGLPPAGLFVQDNHSCSHKGVLRGLHYQKSPHAQGKLVRVVQGSAFDVVVDLRKSSPTFGQSFGMDLSAQNRLMLWIPEGFAHGFLALEDNTHFLYKTTGYYNQLSEACILWNDPELNIPWPMREVVLSPKDEQATGLDLAEFFP